MPMYTLTRSLPASELVLQQAPTIVLALVIAEAFYKFGSFTLEALAFLATWFALDVIASGLRSAAAAVSRRMHDGS
jgi:hypothetical protein